MSRAVRLSLLVPLLLTAGCYHQVVETGATPGSPVIERPWTATFLFGLVPASEISTAAECPNGVAIVETQQSFLNGLVGALTLGIYTPQTVRITCAAANDDLPAAHAIDVLGGSTLDEREAATRAAVEYTLLHDRTVVVRFLR